LKILQRKIQRNPKYENVARTIDTGSSLSNYMEKMNLKFASKTTKVLIQRANTRQTNYSEE
jgi:hypothetical protein